MKLTPPQVQALGVAFGVLIAFQGACHETVGLILFPYGAALFGGDLPWHAFGLGIIALGCWIAWAFLFDRRAGVSWVCAALIPVGTLLFVYTTFFQGDFHVFALAGTLAGIGVIACDRTLQRRCPTAAPFFFG